MTSLAGARRAARLPLVCLFLWLAACASAPTSHKLRRVEQLPPEYRELWSAWLARDPEWSRFRERAREDHDLRVFLVDNLMRHMLQSFGDDRIAKQGDTRLGPFERARAELLRFPEEAVPRLTELLAIGNGTASELAASMLEEIGQPAVLPVLGLLARQEPQARRASADLLGRLPHARAREGEVQARLIAALESDPDWLVRAKAALAVGSRGSRDTTTQVARAALCRALGDSDQSVGVRAVRGLAMLNDPAAVPALINYLERSSQAGVLAGVIESQGALRRLIGESQSHEVADWRELWRAKQQARPRR